MAKQEPKKYVERRTKMQDGKVTRTMIEREVIEDYVDVKIPNRHRLNNGNFIVLFQEAMFEISKNKSLSRDEMRILLYLIGTAGINGSVDLTQQFICEELDIKRPNVSTAIKGLVARNIVVKSIKNGARMHKEPNLYTLSLQIDRLNYNMVWKGKIRDYKHVQHKDEPILLEAKTEKKQINLFD